MRLNIKALIYVMLVLSAWTGPQPQIALLTLSGTPANPALFACFQGFIECYTSLSKSVEYYVDFRAIMFLRSIENK